MTLPYYGGAKESPDSFFTVSCSGYSGPPRGQSKHESSGPLRLLQGPVKECILRFARPRHVRIRFPLNRTTFSPGAVSIISGFFSRASHLVARQLFPNLCGVSGLGAERSNQSPNALGRCAGGHRG